MMKRTGKKTMTARLLSLLTGLALLLCCAACGAGDGGSSTGTESPDGSGTQAETGGKSYQFYGMYEEEGEGAAFADNAFLLTLNEDGTAVVDKYNYYSGDASDVASNTAYTAGYMKGTWEATQKDSVDCLKISLAVIGENGTEANSQTIYSYEISGTYSCELTFPLVAGMSYSREASMEGKEEKTFADENEFIQYYKYEPAESADIATLPGSVIYTANATASDTMKANFCENGVMAIYMTTYDMNIDEKYLWSYDEEAGFTLTYNGGEENIATDNGDGTWSFSDGSGNDYLMTLSELLAAVTEPAQLSTAAATNSETMFAWFFDNHTVEIKFDTTAYGQEGYTTVSKGQWSYDAENGLAITVDNAAVELTDLGDGTMQFTVSENTYSVTVSELAGE